MNTSVESHYIVATHLSSKKEYFPQNKADKFHVKFSKPLSLKSGRWKVAIVDINLVNIINNNPKPADFGAADFYYCVYFSECDGLIIDGLPTRAIRCVTRSANSYVEFENLLYMPVTATLLDTCSIEVCAFSGTEPTPLILTTDSNIRVTLHFRKF